MTHELAGLGRAHRVAVMSEGRVVQEGWYDDLERRGGALSRVLALTGRAPVIDGRLRYLSGLGG